MTHPTPTAPDYKQLLQELVDTIGVEGGRDIDCGCDGNGPLANAMYALGMFESVEAASDAIFEGDDNE